MAKSSHLPMLLFCSVGVRFFGKNATGWNLGFFPKHCESTAPTLDSGAFTSTVKGFMGSGGLRMGAEVKAFLSWMKVRK